MEIDFRTLYTVEEEPSEREGSYRISDIILSGQTERLERLLCTYTGAEHCVCISSATSGLILALRAAGVEAGDTVLCPAFSFFALEKIIGLLGAVPVFVDQNPNTFTIDPYCLEYTVGWCVRGKRRRPKALIAVDLFGMPCDYEALSEVCETYGIALISDMAQSFGASYKGRKAGSLGRFAVASFFPGRPLGDCAGGGAVFCGSYRDMHAVRSMRDKIGGGRETRGGKEMRAQSVELDLIAEKLKEYDDECAARRRVAQWYREQLEPKVRLQQVREEYDCAYTQLAVLLRDTQSSPDILSWLREQGIPGQAYTPVPYGEQAPSPERDMRRLVNTRRLSEKLITLPIHPYLSRHVVEYISRCLLEAADVWQCGQEQAPRSGFSGTPGSNAR